MKTLTEFEMSLILGGNSQSCADVVAEGNAQDKDSDFDWDRWAQDFENICG
ncbi:MAG: hypothetical protein ACRCY5_00260 [Phocaeicola sp.]